MAKLLKLRRGTTTQHGSFTGAEGEVTIDTDKDVPVVHDGSTQGGHPLAAEDMANVSSASIAGRLANDSIAVSKIAAGTLPSDVKIIDANVSGNLTIESADIVDGTIVNADVNGSAAIAGTKVSPDFGSQNVVTTGTLGSGDLTITSAAPKIEFYDSDANSDFRINVDGGVFQIEDITNSQADRFTIASDGTVDVTGNLDVGAGVDVTGNITVSGTVDGRDVAADGTKLDGIETAATADQTASEILTLTKTVDGSGSGLDADTVDGIEGANFVRSDTADTASGDISFDGGAGAVTVNGGSDIRIAGGTWTGEYNGGMKIQHNGTDAYIQYLGTIYHRTGGGDNRLTLDTSGNLTAAGNVTAYSDERLKTDVNTINDALGICGKLRGVSYKWIRGGKPSIGVIAQEVEKVIPEVVLTSHDVNPSTGEVEEIKSVDYGKIVGVLINAINELKAEVDELKGGK